MVRGQPGQRTGPSRVVPLACMMVTTDKPLVSLLDVPEECHSGSRPQDGPQWLVAERGVVRNWRRTSDEDEELEQLGDHIGP